MTTPSSIQSHLAEVLSRSPGRTGIRFPQSIDDPCLLFNVLASPRSWWSSRYRSESCGKHSAHHHHHHHSAKQKEGLQQGYKHGYRRPSKTATAPTTEGTTAAIPRCTAPWFHRCPGASSSPQHPGWFRFTRITTAPASCWARVPSLDTASSTMSDRISKTPARPGATMC